MLPTELPPSTDPEFLGSLSPEDITGFQRIIRETTGEELSWDEACDAARPVLALYGILGPIPEDPETSPSNPDSPPSI